MTDTVPRSDAGRFQWLVANLAAETEGVRDVIAVSADGLLIAASDPAEPAAAQRLAAVVSGLISLAGGAARAYALGGLHKVIIDLAGGYVVVTALSGAAVLAVVAERTAGLGTIAYEMTMFAGRVGPLLTPATILELRSAMG